MKNFRRTALCFLAVAPFLAGCGTGPDPVSIPPPAPPLVAAPPVADTTTVCDRSVVQTDHFSAGASINGQNGWTRTAAGFDEQVENVGAIAQGGQNVWRLSNKVVSGSFNDQPLSPQLSQSAGESTVRSALGGDAMEAVFW